MRMCFFQSSPQAAFSASVTIRYWLMVSAVPPDLVMTLKQVFFRSTTSISAAMRSGSMLSSMYSRGPPRFPAGSSL